MLYVIPGETKAFKYRIVPQLGTAPASPETKQMAVSAGKNVSINLPPSVKAKEAAIRWVIDGSDIESKLSLKGRVLQIKVPDVEAKDNHVWLRIPTETEDLWIDFYFQPLAK